VIKVNKPFLSALFLAFFVIVSTVTSFGQSNIDKVGIGAGFQASGSYSLRLLNSNYTGNAIEVRRSSDNAVQAIGFTPQGNLDTVSLLSFVGVESGYVQTWYDQSGFSKHLVQLVTSNQPRIVNAGVIERQNGVPAIRFVSNDASFFQTLSNISMSGASTVNAVAQEINTTAEGGSIVTHVLQ
jgi:hypothetical protein